MLRPWLIAIATVGAMLVSSPHAEARLFGRGRPCNPPVVYWCQPGCNPPVVYWCQPGCNPPVVYYYQSCAPGDGIPPNPDANPNPHPNSNPTPPWTPANPTDALLGQPAQPPPAPPQVPPHLIDDRP
jgi:hypothetical protein